jgi:uncharacterized membrane protein
MANVVWKETRKRGPVSWGFLILFFTFNAIMLAVGAIYWASIVGTATAADGSGRAGAILGNAMGTGIVMMLWVSGAIILALLAVMTQSQVVLVEEVR